MIRLCAPVQEGGTRIGLDPTPSILPDEPAMRIPLAKCIVNRSKQSVNESASAEAEGKVSNWSDALKRRLFTRHSASKFRSEGSPDEETLSNEESKNKTIEGNEVTNQPQKEFACTTISSVPSLDETSSARSLHSFTALEPLGPNNEILPLKFYSSSTIEQFILRMMK